MKVQFGTKAKDIITGFTGIVTGRTHYISGCSQLLLVPGLDKDGKLQEGAWFDEQRVEAIEGAPSITLDNSKTPGPDRAPTRNI